MSPGQMVLNGQQFGQLQDQDATGGRAKKKEKDEKSKAVASQSKKSKYRLEPPVNYAIFPGTTNPYLELWVRIYVFSSSFAPIDSLRAVIVQQVWHRI